MKLVWGSFGAFPRFVLQEMLNRGDLFWKRCQRPNTKGTDIANEYMDETQFLFLWYILVRSFRDSQVVRLRLMNGELHGAHSFAWNSLSIEHALPRDVQQKGYHHLAAWIVCRFGTLQNGDPLFTLTREGYVESVIRGLEMYRDYFGVSLVLD